MLKYNIGILLEISCYFYAMTIGHASQGGSFSNSGPYLELNSCIIYRVAIGAI